MDIISESPREKTLQEFVRCNLSHHAIKVLVDWIQHDIDNPLLIPKTAPLSAACISMVCQFEETNLTHLQQTQLNFMVNETMNLYLS